MKSVLFPEICYKFIGLTLQSVTNALNGDYAITCVPKYVDQKRKEVVVKLGEGLWGYLPYEEVTIYRMFKIYSVSKNIPVQIIDILEKNIRAKILRIEDGRIILSRKANMLEDFEYLKTCSLVRIHVTRMSWTKLYGDIGDGIVGSMDIREICNSKISNVKEQFRVGDILWVKVQSVQDKLTFFLSYKERFPKYDPSDYEVGSLISCIVTVPLNDPITGYYAIVTPQVRGIVNTKENTPYLRYGSKITAKIIGKNEQGLKLVFVRFPPSQKKYAEQEGDISKKEETEEDQEAQNE